MPINTALVAELKHEGLNTRKMLERVPDDKLNWRPHEKSMYLGRLAQHVAELNMWIERILNADEFDFATAKFSPSIAASTAEILEIFDEKQHQAITLLSLATDEKLNASWAVQRGEQVMFQLPKKVALRSFAYNHIYHHRGQLSVYLRLLNISVPGMYGPSADERM